MDALGQQSSISELCVSPSKVWGCCPRVWGQAQQPIVFPKGELLGYVP